MSGAVIAGLSQVPIARPVIGESEMRAVQRPLVSGWLTQGPEVAAFEREFAAYTGAPHACAVSNCTTALHLALRAVGVSTGDEVITVSHSFIASANAVRYCGAVPVFVDIQPGSYNIDPAGIEAAITARTRAILVVHQLGMPCDLEPIVEIAHRRGLRLVEDAACAAGSAILWRGEWEPIGRPHGDVACFSFHPRKVMTTGDGGMLTTRNADWDRQFRLWRQHSMTVADTARHGSSTVVFEEYSELGFNYRMTDLQAAVGREQLVRLARHGGRAPPAGAMLFGDPGRLRRCASPGRAGVGPQQLAELLRAAARWARPASRHAVDVERGHCHAAWGDVRASRAGVPDRIVALYGRVRRRRRIGWVRQLDRERGDHGARPDPPPVCRHDRRRTRPRGGRARRGPRRADGAERSVSWNAGGRDRRPSGLRVLIELNSADLRIGAVNDALDLAELTAASGARFLLCGPLTIEFCAEADRRGVATMRVPSETFVPARHHLVRNRRGAVGGPAGALAARYRASELPEFRPVAGMRRVALWDPGGRAGRHPLHPRQSIQSMGLGVPCELPRARRAATGVAASASEWRSPAICTVLVAFARR